MELLVAAKLLIAALRRRKLVALVVFLAVLAGFVYAYSHVGRRYDAEAFLLVGNGVTGRSESASVIDPTGINSLARIAATDDVVSLAASKVGYQRLYPDLDLQRNGILREAAARLGVERYFPVNPVPPKERTVISMLQHALVVQPDGKTDLLKISFAHRDPVIAAEFVNALVEALVGKQAELLNVPGASEFFDVQRKQLEKEVEKAASKLETFSAAASIYSINDQRSLLLKRSNELADSLSSVRASILDLEAQKAALTEQLMRLKPVSQSQFVSGIVNSVGANKPETEGGAKTSEAGRALTEAPPLLLVRVYQDTMAALFKVDAEVAGAKNREQHFGMEIESVNKDLAALSSNETEYDRLERELRLAVSAAESYAKRSMEERINTSLANARVSGLRVAQLANPPVAPAFPQPIIFLALGVVAGIILAFAAALLPEAWSRAGTYDSKSEPHSLLKRVPTNRPRKPAAA